MRSRRYRLGSSEVRGAWLLLSPALALLVLVRLVPIAQAVWGSFQEPHPGHATTIGFGNYVFLFQKYPTFWESIGATIQIVSEAVIVQVAISLALAVLLTQRLRGAGAMRTVLLLPLAVPIAAATSVWGIILRPEGPLNGVLAAIGLDPQPFLTSSSQAPTSIVLIISWSICGYWMTVLAAGLNDIPRSLYEAASLDGANAWTTFWRVTLPLMRRPILFVVVAATAANFLVFAPSQILTKGGPAGSTNVLMFEIFTTAFANFDMALASAEIVVLLAVVGALVAVQFRMLGGTKHDP